MSFAADALFVDSGLFHVMPEVSLAPLGELFRTRVITFLVKRGLLPQGRAEPVIEPWLDDPFPDYDSELVFAQN